MAVDRTDRLAIVRQETGSPTRASNGPLSDAGITGEERTPWRGSQPLERSFFARETLTVAQDLVGCYVHRRLPDELGGKLLVGRITETEAYLGAADDAAHTSRGRTKRNQVMFGPPGHAYVYFIYGMWWNLNAVTRPEGTGEGVLIRGVHPILGEDVMRELRFGRKALADGPGKLCQALAITGDDYGVDLTEAGNLFITGRTEPVVEYRSTPRIGIDYASTREELWRFIDVRERRK